MLVEVSVVVPGEDEVVVEVLLLDFDPLAGGFTIVVFDSFLSPLAGGFTVVVFCSQAARSAALAKMQMYFFIINVSCPLIRQG
ncbi:MAG: hypothetical protein ACXWG7_07860 [Chthoniobacterales bacterium]